MLVVFSNKSGGTVEMFEKPALELIKLMDRREAVPSVVAAEDLPEALQTLQSALTEIDSEVAEDASDVSEADEAEEKPKAVGMSTRAFPLIELMQQTVKDGSFLMWDYK